MKAEFKIITHLDYSSIFVTQLPELI